jgi:hypothetical protein
MQARRHTRPGIGRALRTGTLLALAATVSAQQPQPDVVLGEVLVIGEQPGPALWKVSTDDHVLWIMGTYSPLPKQMT